MVLGGRLVGGPHSPRRPHEARAGRGGGVRTERPGAQEKVLRRNVDAEGAVHVVRGVCLSDFIQASAAAHRALRRPG